MKPYRLQPKHVFYTEQVSEFYFYQGNIHLNSAVALAAMGLSVRKRLPVLLTAKSYKPSPSQMLICSTGDLTLNSAKESG